MTLQSQGSFPRKEPALRLIITYKVVRAILALSGSCLILTMTATGHAATLGSVAEDLRNHATSEWAMALTRALVSATTPHHLWLVGGGLAFDGAFSALEGWALHHGATWGSWLVVAATCAFIPFEIVALVRRLSGTRAVVLAANVAIAFYLARRARHEAESRSR